MDYCSLDDAFPVFAAAGNAGESRKKTRKNRHADVKTIEMPPPESVPIRENIEPNRDRFKKEAVPPPMKSADESLPHVISAPEPVQPPAPKQSQDNWFGGYDDEDGSGDGANGASLFPTMSSDNGVEETFMPYKSSVAVEGEYSLMPDFTKTFTAKGLDRAAGIGLPMATMATAPVPTPTPTHMTTSDIAAILKRLERLESNGASEPDYSDSSNMEILMFTMSGIFVMFLMDVIGRGGR